MGDSPDEPSGAELSFEDRAESRIAESLRGGEAEILGKNDLERVVAYCIRNGGPQVGPFFREVLGYTTQGGIDYVFGQIRDRRFGHYSLKDGSEAFGGPEKTPSNEFEDIDGNPYKRVKEEDERASLKDVRGGRYTGTPHDTIKRDHNTPLEDKGTVYHVTDDGEEGWYLNEKLCGKKNGMAHKSELVQAGDDVYLVQTDKEGCMRVVDIYTGDLVFLDEPEKAGKKLKKCTEIKFVKIGHEWCALKSYKDQEQWLRPKSGEVIYEGLRARVGNWFNGKWGPFVRTYDEEGRIIVVGRKKKEHFIKDSDRVFKEADDGPEGDGVHTIDEEVLLKLFLFKKDPNPADEEDTIEVAYRRQDTTDAFGGPNDLEVPDTEGRASTIKVAGITGKLFKNRATKTMRWIASTGRPMFGIEHWDDLKTIEWKYDLEGRGLEGATILKHLEDIGRGHTVKDYQGNAYFQADDSTEPDYHTKIRDFWVLSYKKEGEDRNALIVEAEDPVGAGRSAKSILSNLVHFRWGQLFRTPSTYYLLDGTKADSIDALKEHLGAPSDAQLVNVDDFKDAVVTKSDPRATQMIRLVPPPSGIAPEIQELLDEASKGRLGQSKQAEKGEGIEEKLENAGEDASGGKPAGSKTTSLGAELFPGEGQAADAAEAPAEGSPADAYVGEAPAPAEEAAEPAEAVKAPETKPEGDTGTTEAAEGQQESGGNPKKPLSSFLLGEEGEGGKEKGEQ